MPAQFITMEMVKNTIRQMMTPLRNRVYGIITRAVIESVKDSEGMQVMKLNMLAGESRTDVERFQNFGFTSNPPDNAEAVVVAVGGNRDHLIVVSVSHRQSRLKGLPKGGSAIHSSDGTKPVAIVKTLPDGTVEISHSTSDAKVLMKPSGEIVHKSVGKLLLGDDPLTEFAAIASRVEARIAAVETKVTSHIVTYNLHNHPTAPVGPVSTPAPPDTPFVPNTSVIASSKVNVAT